MGKRHDSSCQYASKGRYFGHKKRSITTILRVMLLFFRFDFLFYRWKKRGLCIYYTILWQKNIQNHKKVILEQMVPVAWNWHVPTLFSIMKAECKNRGIIRFFRVMPLFLKVRQIQYTYYTIYLLFLSELVILILFGSQTRISDRSQSSASQILSNWSMLTRSRASL